MDDNEKIATSCISVIGLLVIATILNGLVISVLWGWFMVPLFGLPPLAIAQAIGVGLVVALLTHQAQPYQQGNQDNMGLLIIFAKPAMFLLMGWIVRMFL